MVLKHLAPHGAWRHGLTCLAIAAALSAWPVLAQAPAGGATGPFEVKPGGSFSAIAAQVLGSPRHWAKLYHPQLSGLPDPNLVMVGQRFELVTAAGGTRYLRLMGSKPMPVSAAVRTPAPAAAAAAARPPVQAAAPAPAPAPAPVAAPAPAPVPAAVAAAPAPAADDTLVIGVLPNIATATLLAQYENMKAWFERTQGTKVRISVPANFKVFFDNTVRGDYDLAVAAPHFARVAQADRQMVPVVMYEPRISALFIGKPDDGLTGPGDVRGKAVGFANPTSLVALYGLQWLRQAGLEPGKDYQVRGARTDMGVGRMLLTGEVAGAVMSNGEFRALPQDEAARLRTVEAFARIPNFIVVAHPRLGTARIDRMKTQFKAFIADKDEGAAFTKATGITGMVDADDAVLRELDPYLVPTRRAMGITN